MTFLTSIVDPLSTDGANNDMFINVTTQHVFGPKTAGAWPATYSTLGTPAFLSGVGAPLNTLGQNGDMYLDTLDDRLYGPKALGLWNGYVTLGAGVSVYSNNSGVQRIQVRQDTAANWTNENPVLARGELGFEWDTCKLKIGTGLVAWQVLPYI